MNLQDAANLFVIVMALTFIGLVWTFTIDADPVPRAASSSGP